MRQDTTFTKGNNPKRNWHLVDLKGKTLGRAATDIAKILIGKHKVDYAPHRDAGDYVVAINAADIVVTGRKLKQKIYYHHSGYDGNLKEITLQQMMDKDPRKVISHALSGMLPKNKHRKPRLTRLKVFVGGDHSYTDKFKKIKNAK